MTRSITPRFALLTATMTVGLVLAAAALAGAPRAAVAHHAPGHGGGPGGGGATATPTSGGTSPTATPPSGGPVDGGTVYYLTNAVGPQSTPWPVRSIAPDGTGDAAVDGIDGHGGSRPSTTLHAGSRWFVTAGARPYVSGFFPSGATLFELDVVREGGYAPVPLTDNAGACIQVWGSGPGVRLAWTPNASGQVDGSISFLGTRWEDTDGDGTCDQAVDGGIFRGAIAIDGAGNVTFDAPTAPEVVVALSGTTTRAAEFSWAPDGAQVAYVDANGDDLWVVDASGTRTMIFGGKVLELDWSPDLDPGTSGLQTRIAFAGFVTKANGSYSEVGTYTIAPNGTGRVRIATGKLQNPAIYHYRPRWSPAGTHLIFDEYNAGTQLRKVRRLESGGGNNVVLVDDADSTSSGPFNLGWTVD